MRIKYSVNRFMISTVSWFWKKVAQKLYEKLEVRFEFEIKKYINNNNWLNRIYNLV